MHELFRVGRDALCSWILSVVRDALWSFNVDPTSQPTTESSCQAVDLMGSLHSDSLSRPPRDPPLPGCPLAALPLGPFAGCINIIATIIAVNNNIHNHSY